MSTIIEGAVKFPIVRHVVEYANTYDRILYKNDVVKCYFCGTPIVLNEDSVYIGPGRDEMVHCPNYDCRRNVSAFYYLGKTEREREPLKNRLKRKKG